MLAHTGKVNQKNSFKQSENEVCADCLDNSINLDSSNAYRVNSACRCIWKLYRGGFLLFGLIIVEI